LRLPSKRKHLKFGPFSHELEQLQNKNLYYFVNGDELMTTPAQYQHQLSGFNYDILDKPLTSKVDAQAALPEIVALQNNLLQLEQGINLEMHVMRTLYQSKLAGAEAGNSSRIMVSAKRRVGSNQRAGEETRLATERDKKIAPYQELKSQFTELLTKVEAARSAAEKLAV
jgi:hypothetical protein